MLIALIVGGIYRLFFAKNPDYFEDEQGQKYRYNETGGKENVED